jgi:UrcA family protein
MKHVRTTLIVALGLYATAQAVPAAERPDGLRQETVRFADLDLTRSAGARELYRRIEEAARDVCEEPGSAGFAVAVRSRLCADRAIARAVADVGSPLLIERYEQTHPEILQVERVGLNR